ncbi:hypothetical protein GCM10009745_05610 [Kribbella yunnanensis]|uniref:Uncharacterized protein n=1 Tax=Kribbella yunnanensis TaxID=190194 RepID=A0ABP4S2G9_9ACTN
MSRGGYRKEDRHPVTKSNEWPIITNGTQSDNNHSAGLETPEIGCKVVTKSSGRQPWLVTRSQSAGRLTPA